MPGESPALPIYGRKEGLVRSGMVRSCGLLSCLVLASNSGVTCENSISGESYLNSSWDNKRPGVVSDVPQKVVPFLKCQCGALRPGPCKVPCRFIIGLGLYDWQGLDSTPVRARVCRLTPLQTWPCHSGFCTTASIPFQQPISENTGPEKTREVLVLRKAEGWGGFQFGVNLQWTWDCLATLFFSQNHEALFLNKAALRLLEALL